MINDLKKISKSNVDIDDNEKKIAVQKLEIEMAERDIYQKKRINMDIRVEIQGVEYLIHEADEQIKARNRRIEELKQELADAQIEYEEFL